MGSNFLSEVRGNLNEILPLSRTVSLNQLSRSGWAFHSVRSLGLPKPYQLFLLSGTSKAVLPKESLIQDLLYTLTQ